MTRAFDTTQNCSSVAACLLSQDVNTVVRYYSRSAWKRVEPAEARALGQAGMKLAAVYQDRQTQPEDFSLSIGRLTGARAAEYARFSIYQPTGSAIFFSVDFDPTAKILNDDVVPFFQGLREGLDGVVPGYRIGVYGSGLTCRTLKTKGVAELFWLAQARGWQGYKAFSDSNEWHLRQEMPGSICGIAGDPNTTNPALPDFGAFLPSVGALDADNPPAPSPAQGTHRVNARSGLRLRSGPGTEFDSQTVLPLGTVVTVLARQGDWAMVDLQGDGVSDGFAFAAYLTAV